MDPHNLRTASLYINNLLLSRGLLRNGTPIEFATPTKGEGGVDATMAKVMNLVHDLILRRDVCDFQAEVYSVIQIYANLLFLLSVKPTLFQASPRTYKRCEHHPASTLK